MSAVWQEFLEIIKQEAGSRIVETWFRAVHFHHWDVETKTAYLRAPNAFVRSWITSNYTKLIRTHLVRLLHVDEINVEIVLESKSETVTPDTTQVVAVQSKPIVHKRSSRTASVELTPMQDGYLNKRYTFDTFVVGPNNSLAYAAAQAVAQSPGQVYNPLFIYGQSGLGKTHLMYAIGNEIKRTNSKSVVLYQTADRFVSEFIGAIRFDKVFKFKQKYQKVDVLLIDDVQFFSNKDQTQEVFFHIFNLLYETKKQIVFSSDMIPQSMQGIAQRLRSRMASGLMVDIHTPRFETKIAILKRKAHANNEVLPDDVAQFIANTVDSNIRELEGALIRVIAFSALTKQPVCLQLAQKVLDQAQILKSNKAINFETIASAVKRHLSHSVQHLQSKSRNKDIVRARQVAMFLMKKHTNKSLRDIGNFLGGRDHSTVMHACNKIEQCIASNESFAKRIKMIERDVMF